MSEIYKMKYQTVELEQIRNRIDTLDNTMHDLLMERAGLVMQIAEEKKKNGIQIVQPAREARMIRRLLTRHHGQLPQETIVRIWRELVGSISLLQEKLSVVVYQPTQDAKAAYQYWDMARDYFGSVLPMNRSGNMRDMIADIAEGRINFAVLPFPDNSGAQQWWSVLRDYPQLKVIQRLPYGQKEAPSFGEYPAVVLAKSGFDSSDDDHSLIMISNAVDVSRARIFESVQKIGLEPLLISCAQNGFLIEVKGYVSTDDDRLNALQSHLAVSNVVVQSVGGFPAPFVYSTEVTDLEAPKS